MNEPRIGTKFPAHPHGLGWEMENGFAFQRECQVRHLDPIRSSTGDMSPNMGPWAGNVTAARQIRRQNFSSNSIFFSFWSWFLVLLLVPARNSI
jgi:hypothetical protein